jgi:hypothetical protein
MRLNQSSIHSSIQPIGVLRNKSTLWEILKRLTDLQGSDNNYFQLNALLIFA